MNTHPVILGLLIEEKTTFSFQEICNQYAISQKLLIEMLEQGLIPKESIQTTHITLDQKALCRMESALRLHRDLGINPPGVTLAIELLEEMEKMRNELDILRKHF